MKKKIERKLAVKRLRFPWHGFVALVFLLLMGLSLSAFADTYNFYFSKKNKHQQEVSSEDNAEREDEDAKPAPEPKPVVPKSDGQTITTAPGQNPIGNQQLQ